MIIQFYTPLAYCIKRETLFVASAFASLLRRNGYEGREATADKRILYVVCCI